MMTYLVYSAFFVLCFFVSVHYVHGCDGEQANEPLFLTPYLESGKIAEAQKKARVTPDINGVVSYTGFFTVDKVCGNNLFFWFVPAENNSENAPVLLWLTGGPGTSSLVGLFMEVGPFKYINQTKQLVENENRWTKDFNVIFLDQPVGTGFSFTEKGCYMTNMTNIAQEVYEAVVQFFTLFPNLQKNNFFLVGDSYTGTYHPAVGVEIDKRNNNAKVKINLKGMLLGNPYMDLSCHNYAPHWFESGLIEKESRDMIVQYQKTRNNFIKQKKSSEANDYEDRIWNIFAETHLPSEYNILYEKQFTLDFKYFVNSTEIRKQLKVGNTHFNATSYFGLVAALLSKEMIVPATPNVKTLLDKSYFVGFYTGQLDLTCSFSSLVCVLDQLKHPEYLKAKRKGWYVDNRLAGWSRGGGNLLSVVIRDSGHLVPTDQAEVALALVKGVIGSYPANTLNLID